MGEDVELLMLLQLLKDCQDDVNDITRPLPVSEAYACHPFTVCTEQADWESKFSQSRLGFLNQSRVARGLPKIVQVSENGIVTGFKHEVLK